MKKRAKSSDQALGAADSGDNACIDTRTASECQAKQDFEMLRQALHLLPPLALPPLLLAHATVPNGEDFDDIEIAEGRKQS